MSEHIITYILEHQEKKSKRKKLQAGNKFFYMKVDKFSRSFRIGKPNGSYLELLVGLTDPDAILFKIDSGNMLIPTLIPDNASSIIAVCDFIREHKCKDCYFEVGKVLVAKHQQIQENKQEVDHE